MTPPVAPPVPAETFAAFQPSDRRKQIERFFVTLYKRKWITLLFFAATVSATALYTLRLPKLYRATSSIIIDLNPPRYLPDTPEVAELGSRDTWRTAEFFNTEFAVIRGTATAGKVVDKLKLAGDSAFVGSAAGTPEAREVAIGRVAGLVSVEQIPDSNLVAVSITSTDPSLAAILANSVTDAYMELNLDRRLRTTTDAVKWLSDQKDSLRTDAKGSEDEVLKFKKLNILVTPREEGNSISEQKLIALTSALNTAQLERIEIEARRKVLAELSKLDSLAVAEDAVISNLLIQSLKGEWVSASKELEGLKSRYGPEHPLYKAADAKVKFLRDNINREVDNVLRSTEVEYKRAVEKEKSISRALDDAKAEALETAELEAEYERKKRDSSTSEKLYELVLSRHKETLLSTLLTSSNIRIHERASVPGAPVHPNVLVNILLGILAGLFGGVLLAFGAEQLDNTIKTQEEIEQRFGLDFLGIIPAVEEKENGEKKAPAVPMRGRNRAVDLYIWEHPKSNVAESCRTVRTNLLFKAPETGLSRILVTSAGPQEGKTTAAVYLGTTLAAGGSRTLLIDTDMRRPRLHNLLGEGNDTGLSTVLLGEASIDDVILPTPVANLFLLRCGPIPPNPAEIVGSKRFSAICDELAKRFDRLVFDSPPVIAVSDPLILSSQVDGVLLVARAGKTTRDLLGTAVKRLRNVRANIFGCVLNDVDFSRKGYGYYYEYYARYGYYYGEGDGKDGASNGSGSKKGAPAPAALPKTKPGTSGEAGASTKHPEDDR